MPTYRNTNVVGQAAIVSNYRIPPAKEGDKPPRRRHGKPGFVALRFSENDIAALRCKAEIIGTTTDNLLRTILQEELRAITEEFGLPYWQIAALTKSQRSALRAQYDAVCNAAWFDGEKCVVMEEN